MKVKELKEKVRELEPWRHDIDLGPFSTFDVASVSSPRKRNMRHPILRWRYIKQFLPFKPTTALDVGCNAGGISFKLEEKGWDVVGIENGQDFKVSNPYEQALLCKEALGSEVEFIETDAFDYLPKKFDIVVALGVLYHITDVPRRNEKNKEEWEKEFADLCVESAQKGVIFETQPRPWLAGHLEEKGMKVICDKSKSETPLGSRQVTVAEW